MAEMVPPDLDILARVDSVKGGGIRNTFAARRREAVPGKQSKSSSLRSEAKPNFDGDPSEISGDYGRQRGGASKQSISGSSARLAKPKHLSGSEAEAFVCVPDAPVTSADFVFGGGRKSLLENSTNLCRGSHRVKVYLKAHSGRVRSYRTPLKPTGCKQHKKKKRGSKRHRRARALLSARRAGR